MFGEGTLTQAQFENFSQGFLEKSKALNDDWQLVEFGQVQLQKFPRFPCSFVDCFQCAIQI